MLDECVCVCACVCSARVFTCACSVVCVPSPSKNQNGHELSIYSMHDQQVHACACVHIIVCMQQIACTSTNRTSCKLKDICGRKDPRYVIVTEHMGVSCACMSARMIRRKRIVSRPTRNRYVNRERMQSVHLRNTCPGRNAAWRQILYQWSV
jgi:hypothetical protein